MHRPSAWASLAVALRDSPTLGKTVLHSVVTLPHSAPSLVLPYLPYVRSVCSVLPAKLAHMITFSELHAVRHADYYLQAPAIMTTVNNLYLQRLCGSVGSLLLT